MPTKMRPVSLTILSWIYIAIGAVGFCYHLNELLQGREFPREGVWIELTEVLAVVCGVFVLRGTNWARWLALAWIAFHVVLSIHQLQQFAIHSVFLAVIAYVLFRPAATRYFVTRFDPA